MATAWHDVSQVVAAYGRDRAMTILNNHAGVLVLPGSRDPLTASFVDDQVGDTVVEDLGSRNGLGRLRRLGAGRALYLDELADPAVVDLQRTWADRDLLRLAKAGRHGRTPEVW